jgi:hypothetical protein
VSYRRLHAAGRASDFRSRRLARLLGPTFVFIGFWVLVEAALNTLDLGGDGPIRAMRWGFMTPFAPLWFLGVYLLIVLLVPATLWLHDRLGVVVPAAILSSVVAVDWAAFALGQPRLLGINVVLVWLLPSQIGYFYADGRLQRMTAGRWAWVAAGLLVVLIALTTLPWYGRNLLDNGVTVIGITAPTTPFAVLSLLAIAVAMALRNRLETLLRRPSVGLALARLSPLAMSIFLWHMTAYFAAVALMAAIRVPMPSAPDLTWWLERPLFVLLPAALLLPLLWLFGRFDRATGERSDSPRLAAS